MPKSLWLFHADRRREFAEADFREIAHLGPGRSSEPKLRYVGNHVGGFDSDETGAKGPGGGVGLAADVEFPVDVADVAFDRALADDQPVRDLAVA